MKKKGNEMREMVDINKKERIENAFESSGVAVGRASPPQFIWNEQKKIICPIHGNF